MIATPISTAITGGIQTSGAAIEDCAALAVPAREDARLLLLDVLNAAGPSATLAMGVTPGAFLPVASPAWVASAASVEVVAGVASAEAVAVAGAAVTDNLPHGNVRATQFGRAHGREK
jgi:hypothetical protein